MLYVYRLISSSQQYFPHFPRGNLIKRLRGLADVQLVSGELGWNPGSLILYTTELPVSCPNQKLWFPSHIISLNVTSTHPMTENHSPEGIADTFFCSPLHSHSSNKPHWFYLLCFSRGRKVYGFCGHCVQSPASIVTTPRWVHQWTPQSCLAWRDGVLYLWMHHFVLDGERTSQGANHDWDGISCQVW